MTGIKKTHVVTTQVVKAEVVVDGQSVSGNNVVLEATAGTNYTNTMVTDGGQLRVDAGATATGTQVNGGFLEVEAGGNSFDAVITGGGEEDIFGTATRTTDKGGDMLVGNGGVLKDSVIDGGTGGDVNDVYLVAGGKGINNTLNAGGEFNLESGSKTSGTIINNGGVEFLQNNTESDGAVVNSGGFEYQLFTDSVSTNLTVNSGGNGVILGKLEGATIKQGGVVTAYDGSVVTGSITDNGNLTFHLNGTEHFAGDLTGVGVLEVQNGGTLVVDNPLLNFNGTVQVDTDSTVELAVAPNALTGASNAHVNLGDFQATLKLDDSKDFTGTISGFAVQTGNLVDAADVVFTGDDKASYADHGDGTGTLTITDASNKVLAQLALTGDYTGDAFTLASDGGNGTDISVVTAPVGPPPSTNPPPNPPPGTPPSVDGGTVTGANVVVEVAAGVNFTNTMVTNQGQLRVDAGATATGTKIDGGFLEVSVGGNSFDAVITGGGEEDIFGTATRTTDKGGDMLVGNGGVLKDSVIDGGTGGDVNDVYLVAGGQGINNTLNAGGEFNLESGSKTSGTVINSGGVEFLQNNTESDSAVVNSGGFEYQLFTDSVSNDLTVKDGGNGVILGTLDSATIEQGGVVTAYDGSVVKGSITDNGNLTFHLNGTEHFAGDGLTGTGVLEVQNGGTLVVDDALNFAGTAKIDTDSTLELAAANSNTNVQFGDFQSTLKLDNSQSFTGTVAGTAGNLDTIDLADLAFVKGVTTVSFTENAQHTGGVLTVSDQAMGGPVVNLNLLGNYSAAAFSIGADSLMSSQNPHPGTAIHGPF